MLTLSGANGERSLLFCGDFSASPQNKRLAKRGKNTMGWFFCFKLHLVINSLGQILGFDVTPGNVDDRDSAAKVLTNLKGKVFGDKGYISSKLLNSFLPMAQSSLHHSKKNIAPKIMCKEESDALSKRSLIEAVFNVLKNSCRIEHSRHRSPRNFIVNLLGS
jgi:hypothetical protein